MVSLKRNNRTANYVKSLLTACDSSKDMSVNRAVLSSSRFNVATLNSCAQFLDIGNLVVIPPPRKNSSAANQSLFDSSFAVQGPKLWNAMPYHLNVIQELEQFKDQLIKFMLSLPDMPPIRGYTPPNFNSHFSAVLAK